MIPHVKEFEKGSEFEDPDLQYAKTKHVKWYHKILLNRTLKVVIALLLVAVLTPILLYQFIYYSGYDLNSPDGFSLGSCLVSRSSRLPCGLGNVSVHECHQQCCYDHSNNMCFHRFPSRFSYIIDRHWAEEVFLKPRVATVPYKLQNGLTNIRLSLDEVSTSHLTITFYNSAEFHITGRRIEDKDYEYQIESPELNVVVNSSQGNIFDTIRGPVIASKNIWEVAFKLTEESMYGFGQIPIKPDTVKMIYNHRDGLSSIPLIYAKINESYHGLLIDTIDPTEVSFRDENVVVIRSITNFGLKFHLFVGPKPVDVMKDVMKFVNFNKKLEYWMLGAHICSEFSDEIESSTDISEFIREATTYNMPFESHCVKPIVFDNSCETEQVKHINEGARLLENAGKKFVPHVSPYILYETVVESNDTEVNDSEVIMPREQTTNCSYNIKDYSKNMLRDPELTGMYKGLVGNEQVIYPDYENVTAEFMEMLWVYTTDIDGVVLENNWPLDESEKFMNRTYQDLPYFSENFEKAFNHTPRWNTKRVNGEKYLYKHNEYGNDFSKALELITPSPIGAPSQWMNGNVYISRQDIGTSWTNLQKELLEAALGGISGHWLWSTPICGDTDKFDIEIHASLCVKWYLAATYMPMIRIHSKETSRDPLSFTGTRRTLMINALKNRLMLSPYFYTTLQDGPLLRPMFYQFPESEILKDVISQFSVGNDLLIVPNLQPSQSMVHVRMPPGVWFELWSGLKIDAEENEAVTMATTEADFLTLIRGGSIIAMQKDVKLTADATRSQSNLSLTIALECNTLHEPYKIEEKNTTECVASGTLYMSPSASIHMEADGEKLSITVIGNPSVFCNATNPFWHLIEDINIYGLEDRMNNYDHTRFVSTVIYLCDFQSTTLIEFYFLRD